MTRPTNLGTTEFSRITEAHLSAASRIQLGWMTWLLVAATGASIAVAPDAELGWNTPLVAANDEYAGIESAGLPVEVCGSPETASRSPALETRGLAVAARVARREVPLLEPPDRLAAAELVVVVHR